MKTVMGYLFCAAVLVAVGACAEAIKQSRKTSMIEKVEAVLQSLPENMQYPSPTDESYLRDTGVSLADAKKKFYQGFDATAQIPVDAYGKLVTVAYREWSCRRFLASLRQYALQRGIQTYSETPLQEHIKVAELTEYEQQVWSRVARIAN